MRLKQVARRTRAILGIAAKQAPKDEAKRTYRRILHSLVESAEPHYPLARGRQNVLILQMGKVASTSIRSALKGRGMNALHSHGLSPARQHGRLSSLLGGEPTVRSAGRHIRDHVHSISLQMLIRWHLVHRQFKGRRLKVITLTRDPITRYPSAFLHRREAATRAIVSWQRERLGLGAHDDVPEAGAIADLLMEMAAIIVENQPLVDKVAREASVARAQERWPKHPIVAAELMYLTKPLVWFDEEIRPVFGLDLLSCPELREHGWAERSCGGVDLLVLRFEGLLSLIPQVGRFLDIADLALPRRNVTAAKQGADVITDAMRAVLGTPQGQACARVLRSSPYGQACGYDTLA